MDDPRWGRPPTDMILHALGRLDAKADYQTSQLQNLQRALDHTLAIWALKTSMPTDMSGRNHSSKAPDPETDTPTFLMAFLSHIGPKAIAWALARAMGFLLQYLLPVALLVWGMTTKWAGVFLHWLLG